MVDTDKRLNPPREVREIVRRLEGAGFETWCVGGAVRDALLGRAHLDWDVATQATPDRVRSLFKRTVPVGIDFGTVGVLDRNGVMHEVTTFRRDVRTDGRHADVEFGVSLDDDLARRDFTINAIAYSPSEDRIHDPFGGRRDLDAHLLRAVGEPAARMKEDRLRALRALRFAARFGFEIDPDTWRAIVDSSPVLTRLSRERVQQEIRKTMEQVTRPSTAMELWRRSGALSSLIPELTGQPPVAFAAADYIGVPEATSNPALASSRAIERLASIFLGIDPVVGTRTLRDLRFSNHDADWIGRIVSAWTRMEPAMHELLIGGETGDAQIRRWIAGVGRTAARDFLRVTAARWSAARDAGMSAPAGARVSSMFRRALRMVFGKVVPLSVDDLAIDGDDLRELGEEPGPRIGTLLRYLLDQVLEDPSRNTRDQLLDLARRAPDALPGAWSR